MLQKNYWKNYWGSTGKLQKDNSRVAKTIKKNYSQATAGKPAKQLQKKLLPGIKISFKIKSQLKSRIIKTTEI